MAGSSGNDAIKKWNAASNTLSTVVATGLGKPVARVAPQPVQVAAHAPALTMRVVRPRTPLQQTDYAMLDKPTVQRQRAVGDGLRAEVASEDLLDIPAFLRRQAD